MTDPQQVWLITGASSGFGVAIAKEVLLSGHRVIATARNPASAATTYPEIESLGGRWTELDVTSPTTAERIASMIQEIGQIDVVVNNAGYSILGSFEDLSEGEIHQQLNTNLYGPLRVMKAVLPFFREQLSGTIVNIGSVGGIQARPAFAGYSASKFGLEGLSECIAQEVSSFNIRTIVVVPGSFRTNFLGASQPAAAGVSADYQGTVSDNALKAYVDKNGKQPGDPVKAAQRIVDVVLGRGMAYGKAHFLRLPLGSDCVQQLREKIADLTANVDAMEEIANSTGF